MLLAAVSWGAIALPATVPAKDQDLFNQAKVLMFEQKWEEARQAFQRLIRDYPQSALLPQAYFHTAYCLRLQKKAEEALLAYDLFLQKYPAEPFFAEQAKQAVVDLAAALVDQGKTTYRSRLLTALADPKKEVRYFAAIRCSSLKDRELKDKSVPILRDILAKEKQPELLNYASISLLRIDPEALSRSQPQKTKSQPRKTDAAVQMFHIRIWEGGENTQPKVDMQFPVSLAQLAISALDESTKAEIRKKGFDIDNIWESLKRLGPTNILTIRTSGGVVKLWIQ
jgi:tetratricopeptide (TPR) repeat protein